jgi:diguanylate cyclase (GGDEF)-like protein
MNGLKLIEEVRKNYKREDLAILGLSIVANKELTVQLLKTGANDYMTKPIMVDEFYCRVSQSVNMVRNVRTIKESSTTDFLTKVSNRRSLFDSGKVLYENARRGTLHIAMAMIDADFFKKVNDTYGHDAGDKLLIALARTLKHTVRPTDIVARFGGEEFVCIAVINKPEDAAEVFERVRCEIEALTVTFGEHYLNVTTSIGVTTALCDSFEGMLKRADRALYRAKEGGRNCVVVD